MTVFKFNIWYIGQDYKQVRFVVAEDEQEAISKLDSYRRKMVNNGFANFTWSDPIVEIDSVIV